MKPNIRAILEDCIERGVEDGIRRAHKHSDAPGNTFLGTCVEESIWLQIDEYFAFEDEP